MFDMTRRGVIAAAIAAFLPIAAMAQTDPLPAWNDGPTKQAIIDFVSAATQAGGPGFVPVADRIAVFDMDGTLIPEKPVPAALVPIMADLEKLVADRPILQDRPEVAALMKGDFEALHALGELGLNNLLAVLTEGKTTEDFSRNILPLMKQTQNAKYGVSFADAVYKPMAELLAYLEANGFQNWISSGSPILFTRAMSMEMVGIPPEHVMGTYAGTRLDERDGKTVLIFDGTIGHLNDREGKPVTINLAIGKRPVFVGGNEGGRGDIAMMRWSKDRDGPSFQLLIDHDDAAREFEYSEPDNYSLDAAKKYGFHTVSMKNDWKEIIGP